MQLALYQHAHPEMPWLCRDAIGILDSWVKPTDRALEWGTGRSTVWFASRVAHLISVEHNPTWGESVSQELDRCGLASRVDLRVLPDGVEEKPDSRYVSVAKDIAPGTLDLCLVDGVSRDHCVLACLKKLKPGGLLVVDNINKYIPRRPKSRAPNSRGPEDGCVSSQWAEFVEATKNWRCIWITNGVWDTALWVTPCPFGGPA